jgi:hypothetical protein
MTNFIRRTFEHSPPPLIILQITLSFWETSPQVELALIRDASKGAAEKWKIPARELGVPDSIDGAKMLDLNLTPQMIDGLKSSLKDGADNLPLWLRFAKPHGFLSALPWERVLTQALQRPVLRLPDLLERPYENRDVLELAICFDPDRSANPDKLRSILKQTVTAILSASPRTQTRLHLFTPSYWYKELQLQGAPYDKRLQIHDPATAKTNREISDARKAALKEKPGSAIEASIQSLWSIWMKSELGSRSLDAIYFICESAMSEFQPTLRMSSSLSPREEIDSWSYVDAQELAAIVTRAGAWAAVFSNPRPESAIPVLALMADALAHTRPTTVLYQRLDDDRQIASLRTACAFLFAPNSAPAPSIAEGFLYCPPSYVDAYANLEIASALPGMEKDASIFDSTSIWDRARAYVTPYIPGIENYEIEQAPSWATALQRQSEFLALERLRRNGDDVLLSSAKSASDQVGHAATSIASDSTLDEIHKVIGDYLRNKDG